MIPQDDFINISIYQQRLNLKNAIFERIEHDDATVAVVYKVIQPIGPDLILKICPQVNQYFRELYFLNCFENTLPTPHVIQMVPPEQNLSGAILMEFLPGKLATRVAMSDVLIYEIGSLLAQIHQRLTVGYGDLIKQHELYSDATRYFKLNFQEGLEECKNQIPKELIKLSQDYLDKNVHLLRNVDGPCVVHRDFRAGNVLIDRDKVSGIIDWSSSRASFAEEDFVTLDHSGWNFSNTQKQLFLSGYASIRSVPDYRKIMPLLRLNKALATLGFTIKTKTFESSNAKLYNFNRQWVRNFFCLR